MNRGHFRFRCQDLFSSVKHDSSGKVDGHEGRGAEEEVVQPDHVAVVRQHMPEPGDQPGEGEDGAQVGSLHVRVQGRPRPLHKRVHQLEQGHGLLHGWGHELLEVREGKTFHDVEGKLFSDD